MQALWRQVGTREIRLPASIRRDISLVTDVGSLTYAPHSNRKQAMAREKKTHDVGTKPKSFRNSAAFGKRIEYWIIGRMLKEGIDVYVPLVDDHAVDAIIKCRDGSTALIQIKARSRDVIFGDAALFAAIPHEEVRLNYWFVFYSERMDMIWVMSSDEFDKEAVKNKSGKNNGRRSIWFNGKRTNKLTGTKEEYCKAQWEKYLANDFARISNI